MRNRSMGGYAANYTRVMNRNTNSAPGGTSSGS